MAVSPLIRPDAVDTALIARGLKVAQDSEFAFRIGNPNYFDPKTSPIIGSAISPKFILHNYRSLETEHSTSAQARLNTSLMLLGLSRAQLEEYGFDVRPNLAEAGILFGVRRPDSSKNNGRLRRGIEGRFDLVYISGSVVDGVAAKISDMQVLGRGSQCEIAEEFARPINLSVQVEIANLAMERKVRVWKDLPLSDQEPEIRPLVLSNSAAKEVQRYARLTRQAQMYENRAL